MKIQAKDIKYESYRAHEVPGGQHHNGSTVGVIIIHIPTDTRVGVHLYRSQHENKEAALLALEFLLDCAQ